MLKIIRSPERFTSKELGVGDGEIVRFGVGNNNDSKKL